MAQLLGGVAAKLGTLGKGLCGGSTQRGNRLDGVAILTGIARELLASQLTLGPALVEGVLEHVPSLAAFLDAIKNGRVHWSSVLSSGGTLVG